MVHFLPSLSTHLFSLGVKKGLWVADWSKFSRNMLVTWWYFYAMMKKSAELSICDKKWFQPASALLLLSLFSISFPLLILFLGYFYFRSNFPFLEKKSFPFSPNFWTDLNFWNLSIGRRRKRSEENWNGGKIDLSHLSRISEPKHWRFFFLISSWSLDLKNLWHCPGASLINWAKDTPLTCRREKIKEYTI